MAAETTRPTLEYLRLTARAAARELVWAATCRFRPGDDPNILLFATRRGGSTWLMELIAANRGVRPMNQPLETLSRNVTYAQMLAIPRYRDGQITSVGPDQHDALKAVVDAMCSGEVVVNAPTAFWRRDHDWVADRVVLKITDAKASIAWFDEHIDASIVFLTRHPIPQALSCIRNRWTLTTDAYLADERFVERYLVQNEGFCRDIAASGPELERWVLNWALENLAPIVHLPEHPDWLHVRYEDCVSQPDATLERVADRLALTDVDAMRAIVRRPSGSSRRSTSDARERIAGGEASANDDAWRATVDDTDIAAAHAILERLGIDPGLLHT